jgi:hypothetical protein
MTIRATEPAKPARPEIRRPTTMVARGSAQPIAQEIPEVKPPASAEPKVIPIRKPEPPAKIEPLDAPALALTPPSSGLSPAAKGGMVAAALALLIGGGWFVFKGNAAKTDVATAAPVIDTAAPLAPLGGGGWTSNWGAEAATNHGKQISLYRPTMALPDYRIELIGQIDKKAIGWIFRAQDPKNYYVMKLEQIKPGVEPVVALVKYSVVNGKESTRTQVMLPIQATMTTMFKIRTDVKGNKFTTYVQDQLADYWTDDQHKVGGAGLYVDAGERALIKTTNISALR